jgi:hypothetical protein
MPFVGVFDKTRFLFVPSHELADSNFTKIHKDTGLLKALDYLQKD